MADLVAYASLFLTAFVAATLFPAGSEAVLVGLLLAGSQSVAGLLIVATVGNVLGSLVNWVLGRWIEHFRDRPWFPVKPAALTRAQSWYQRYGKWSLLLSWAPIIGDPLTVAAGLMRERLGVFLALVAIAKFSRYVVLVLVTLKLSE
jgi:membrane protein YqaA with SNARE-associated domain